MKDFLFCHCNGCGFSVGVNVTGKIDWNKIDKCINDFKTHLLTHTKEELVEYCYQMTMMIREFADNIGMEKEIELKSPKTLRELQLVNIERLVVKDSPLDKMLNRKWIPVSL